MANVYESEETTLVYCDDKLISIEAGDTNSNKFKEDITYGQPIDYILKIEMK